MPDNAKTQLHASAVAFGGKGCLILGRTGQGKSTLALEMIAFGAHLIGDDRIDLCREGGRVLMSCPSNLRGMIEIRGIGLIKIPVAGQTPLDLIVDLDADAAVRLPGRAVRDLLGLEYPVISGARRPALAALIMVILRSGGILPEDTFAR